MELQRFSRRRGATFVLFLLIALFGASFAYGDQFSVMAYGAKGDGATNDTVAIQSALNAAQQTGGGVVYMPSGRYLTDRAVLVPSNTTLKGDGRGKTVIISPAGNYPKVVVNGANVYATIALVAVSNSVVCDLTVDHAANGTTSNGLALLPDGPGNSGVATTNSIVRDIEVIGFNSHQYLIWNLRGVRNKIINNIVDGRVPLQASSTEEGIELFGSEDVLVSGNTVRNIGNNAIYLSSGADAPGSTTHGAIVTDNHIENARVGIYLSVDTYEASQVLIKNNNVRNTWSSGIALTAGVTSVKDVSITGNNILNTVNEGIRLLGTNGGTYSNISAADNTIDNVTGSTGFGVSVYSISNVSINNNTIKNGVYGFYVTSGASNIDITANRVEEQTKNAILIGSASNVGVSSNHFRNYDKEAARNPGVYADRLASGRIIANEFKYASVESYAVWAAPSSSGVRVAQNILNYTSTFTPPFRNDGASSSSDIMYGDDRLPVTRTGIIVKDKANGRNYRVFVDRGSLKTEVVP